MEIENKLPGRTEFNALIQLYRRKNWVDLGSAIQSFRIQFESSPLVEAVDFLELQSDLDQISEPNENSLKKVENKFRELLILYPRSNLSPVLHASLANYYLRTGSYAKAEGLYHAAREQNPFHATSCTHLFGEAEANYLMRNFGESERYFRSVIQKCQSNRLQVAAQIRMIDIRREKGEALNIIEKEYEKIRTNNPTLISRFHPELIFNLGEIKYRSKIFPSSTFYFNDFSRSVTESHVCQPALQKRLADLSKHNKKRPNEVIGHYLSVYENYPKSDMGRFSRVHALLLDFTSITDAELKRRTDLIDSELVQIRDAYLKDFGSIEQGLAFLERKDEYGLDVLQPLKNRLENLFRGELDAFIRDRVLDQIRGPFPGFSALSDRAKDKQVLEPLERTYKEWFYQTPDAEKAELAYRIAILDRFNEAIQAGNGKSALAKLERWKRSELFNVKWLDSETRYQLGGALGTWWIQQAALGNQDFSKLFLEKRETLEGFFQPGVIALVVQANLDLNDLAGMEKSLKELPSQRSVAGKKSKAEEKAVSAYAFMLGRAFRIVREFQKSLFYLNQVSYPGLENISIREKIRTLTSAGKARDAIELGVRVLDRKPASPEKELLLDLRDAIVSGKQWKYSEKVFKAAKKAFGGDKSLVPFLTMEGKSLLEQGKWKASNDFYSQAIKIDPSAKDIAETRFNNARCLIGLKDVEAAKKEWQAVADLKDEFWSPLASNELKLLEK